MNDISTSNYKMRCGGSGGRSLGLWPETETGPMGSLTAEGTFSSPRCRRTLPVSCTGYVLIIGGQCTFRRHVDAETFFHFTTFTCPDPRDLSKPLTDKQLGSLESKHQGDVFPVSPVGDGGGWLAFPVNVFV